MFVTTILRKRDMSYSCYRKTSNFVPIFENFYCGTVAGLYVSWRRMARIAAAVSKGWSVGCRCVP
jgi:hypothetical protein